MILRHVWWARKADVEPSKRNMTMSLRGIHSVVERGVVSSCKHFPMCTHSTNRDRDQDLQKHRSWKTNSAQKERTQTQDNGYHWGLIFRLRPWLCTDTISFNLPKHHLPNLYILKDVLIPRKRKKWKAKGARPEKNKAFMGSLIYLYRRYPGCGPLH